MNNIKHIHEVIFLIEKQDQELKPEELIETIETTWGPDVHFGSCSGNAFPKEYALDFLISRQKVLLSADGKVILHPGIQLCKGHEEF